MVELGRMSRPFDERTTAVERARTPAEQQAAVLQRVRSDVLDDFSRAVWRPSTGGRLGGRGAHLIDSASQYLSI